MLVLDIAEIWEGDVGGLVRRPVQRQEEIYLRAVRGPFL